MDAQRRGRHALVYVFAMTALWSFAVAAQTNSNGWFKAGNNPVDYDMGIDRNAAFTGGTSGYIRGNKLNPQGFGTYMQMFDPGEYRGKRLRLSAYVKSENVADWAGVWMRVDRDKQSTAFDNMSNRPIKGTQEWTQCSIVLDVDSKATAIAFGILLSGKGSVWIDDLSFEVVGEEVPVTDLRAPPKRPRNLDFENGPERQ